jgi:hypothetical protein
MVKPLRSLLCVLLCVLLFPLAAFAEDCFVIDIESLDLNSLQDDAYVAKHLTAQTQGIRVRKYISDSNELAARVRLTILQAETSTVVFDKNYGYVSGTFDSGDIYLPYVDNNVIPYLITVNIENLSYAIPFMHLQPRLQNNSACTYGIRISDYSASLAGDWQMGTMLDLDTLRRQGSAAVPLCASNLYIVGQATLAVSDEQLVVTLAFEKSANVEVERCSIYLIGDVSRMTSANPEELSQPAYSPGQSIRIDGFTSALLYLPLLISYDPSELSNFNYDLSDTALKAQLALWNQNLQAAVP